MHICIVGLHWKSVFSLSGLPATILRLQLLFNRWFSSYLIHSFGIIRTSIHWLNIECSIPVFGNPEQLGDTKHTRPFSFCKMGALQLGLWAMELYHKLFWAILAYYDMWHIWQFVHMQHYATDQCDFSMMGNNTGYHCNLLGDSFQMVTPTVIHACFNIKLQACSLTLCLASVSQYKSTCGRTWGVTQRLSQSQYSIAHLVHLQCTTNGAKFPCWSLRRVNSKCPAPNGTLIQDRYLGLGGAVV